MQFLVLLMVLLLLLLLPLMKRTLLRVLCEEAAWQSGQPLSLRMYAAVVDVSCASWSRSRSLATWSVYKHKGFVLATPYMLLTVRHLMVVSFAASPNKKAPKASLNSTRLSLTCFSLSNCLCMSLKRPDSASMDGINVSKTVCSSSPLLLWAWVWCGCDMRCKYKEKKETCLCERVTFKFIQLENDGLCEHEQNKRQKRDQTKYLLTHAFRLYRLLFVALAMALCLSLSLSWLNACLSACWN